MAEKDRDNLIDAKVESEQFILLEENIAKKKNLLYQLLENQQCQLASKYQDKIQEMNEKMKRLKDEKETTDKQRQTLEKEYEKKRQEYNKMEKELQASMTVSFIVILFYFL
jgi:septal ring factor EnvC (AmiA/AmiB activator)